MGAESRHHYASNWRGTKTRRNHDRRCGSIEKLAKKAGLTSTGKCYTLCLTLHRTPVPAGALATSAPLCLQTARYPADRATPSISPWSLAATQA